MHNDGITRIYKRTLVSLVKELLPSLLICVLFLLPIYLLTGAGKRLYTAVGSVLLIWLIYSVWKISRYFCETIILSPDAFAYRRYRKTWHVPVYARHAAAMLYPPEEPELLEIDMRHAAESVQPEWLVIELKNFIDNKQISGWVRANLKTVHAEPEKEIERILNNSRHGKDRHSRVKKLKLWMQWNEYLKHLGAAFFLYINFYPVPYDFVCITALILQAAALSLPRLSGGIVRVELDNRKASPYLGALFLGPAGGLVLRNIHDMQLVARMPFFIGLAIALLIVYPAVVKFTAGWRSGRAVLFSLFFFSVLFCAGLLGYADRCFKDTPSEVRRARIVQGWEESGSNPRRFFLLALKPPINADNIYEVPRDIYRRHKKDDTAEVQIFSGNLHIPYYKIK